MIKSLRWDQMVHFYASDFGIVHLPLAPRHIAKPMMNARLTKNGSPDKRTKAGKKALAAQKMLDALIQDAYVRGDDEAMRKLGIDV